MSVANWTKIQPTSGSGNSSVNVSAAEHTGRVQRTTQITVTGVGVAEPAIVNAVQSPKAEFAAFDLSTDLAVAAKGGAITISGKTNSSKLKFEWVIPENHTEAEYDDEGNESLNGINFPTVEIPSTYLANGADTANDASIDGDPGATAEFPFSITLNYPENTAIANVNRVLKVTCAGGQAIQLKTVQTAGAAYLRVSPESITIPQAGTPAVAITVESNTTWTIS